MVMLIIEHGGCTAWREQPRRTVGRGGAARTPLVSICFPRGYINFEVGGSIPDVLSHFEKNIMISIS
jgi:hypothetical protein